MNFIHILWRCLADGGWKRINGLVSNKPIRNNESNLEEILNGKARKDGTRDKFG